MLPGVDVSTFPTGNDIVGDLTVSGYRITISSTAAKQGCALYIGIYGVFAM